MPSPTLSKRGRKDDEHAAVANMPAAPAAAVPEVDMRHAQKLEALGQLAAGIAHEISTPVQFVGDSVSFLKGAFADVEIFAQRVRALAEGNEPVSAEDIRQQLRQLVREADVDYLVARVPRAVDRVVDGLGRVATIVRAMKDFSHPDQREQAPADLNEAVERSLVITRGEYKHVAEVRVDLGQLPRIRCHIGDIQQVLVNLLTNAAHAVEERAAGRGARGRIDVQTRLVEEADGRFVVISIADNGGGIPQEVQPYVFDAFFTTKPPGRGTGQGLAISRALVEERHGGRLTFVSQAPHGATFFVRLPVKV